MMRLLKKKEQNTSRSVTRSSLPGFIAGLLLVLFVAGITVSATAQETSAATTGFQIKTESGKKVCYYYNNGKKLVNSWLTLQGKKYYFDSKGHQVTGWAYGSSKSIKRFFYNSLGAKGYMATGFVTDSSGRVRFFDTSSGNMYRGSKVIDGTYRYFDMNNGVLYTGIHKIGGYYYLFLNNKDIRKRGIRYMGGWYATGGKRYYFNKTNGRAQTGWMTLNNKKYYFSSTGTLYYNTSIRVNGKYYRCNKNGVTTEIKKATSLPTSLTIASTYTSRKVFSYVNHGTYVTVYDSKNGRNYNLVSEYATDYGVANGASTDRDILAALCEAEAGDQGLIGMEAVAMCILNRTLKADKEFPSEVRFVVYQTGPRQYSTTVSAVNQRLRGTWINKTLAYQAADAALQIFTAYLKTGRPRVIPGFYNNQDHNFMYFMMNYVFSSSYSRGGFRYVYRDHTFFIDWA